MRLKKHSAGIAFVLCLGLSVLAGVFFHGSFPRVSAEELGGKHESFLSSLGAVLSYSDQKGLAEETFTDGNIVSIRPSEKHQYGETVVATAEVLEVYSGNLKPGSVIRIKEPYSYSDGVNYSAGLYVPMENGSTYLVDLSIAGNNLFEITADEFGIIPAEDPEFRELSGDLQEEVSSNVIMSISADYETDEFLAEDFHAYHDARAAMIQRAEAFLNRSSD